MKTFAQRQLARLLWIVAGLHVGVALAQTVPGSAEREPFYELRAGAQHSDNMRRTYNDEFSGTLRSVGMAIDANHDGRRLDTIVRADIDWVQYPGNTFDDALLGYFDGSVFYDLIPERLQWHAQETFTQRTTNAFLAATPDNLGAVNDFTTGPRLRIPLTSNMAMRLSGDYSITNQEEINGDSKRYSGTLGVVREFTRSNQISLNAGAQHVSFNDVPDSNYNLQQFFLAYAGEGRRTVVNAELGYSVLDLRSDKSNGMLVSLDVARRVSASSTVGLFASKEFSDAGDVFRRRLDVTGSANAPTALAATDVFENRTAGIRWSFLKGRTQLSVSASRTQERYERTTTADRDFDGIDIRLQRRMTPHLTLRLAGTRQREEFQTVDFDARETSIAGALEWAFGRSYGLSFQHEWRDRRSSEFTTEFTENRTGVTLFYRPHPRR